jgi:hypothetical protein
MAKQRTLNRLKARQARPVWDSDLSPGPTAETVRKCKQDNMLALYTKGQIDLDELRAVEHIRSMFEAVSRGLMPRAVDHTEPYSDRPGKLPRKGLETLTGAEYDHWTKVYKPWSVEEAKVMVTPALRRSELMHLLVVENVSPREVETIHHFRHGTSLDHLHDSLQLYCVCAGWC